MRTCIVQGLSLLYASNVHSALTICPRFSVTVAKALLLTVGPETEETAVFAAIFNFFWTS